MIYYLSSISPQHSTSWTLSSKNLIYTSHVFPIQRSTSWICSSRQCSSHLPHCPSVQHPGNVPARNAFHISPIFPSAFNILNLIHHCYNISPIFSPSALIILDLIQRVMLFTSPHFSLQRSTSWSSSSNDIQHLSYFFLQHSTSWT